LLRAALGMARRLDLQRALVLARVGRRVLAHERGWCLRNLALVFGPHLDVASRERLAGLAFEHHFMSYLEGARASEVMMHVPPEVETLLSAWREGRGVVCCTVHLGSWESTVALAGTTGLPVAVVYREAQNPLAEREFQRAREACEVEWIPRARLMDAGRALREGKVLMLMTDVNTVTSAVTADFLGIPAQCPSLAARFARHYGAPIVPAVAIRMEPGHARLPFGEVIRPEAHADAASLTRAVNAALEPRVLEHAEQYNWLHPRWRTRPDGRTWTLAEPLTGQVAERVAPFAEVPARVRALLGLP